MSNKKTSQQLTAEKRIETGTDLSDAQVINAYLANHAVEHYCAALKESEEETTAKLETCKKEEGIYWLYTCPTLGGKKTDGTPYPTKEEWMKANPAAVEVRTILGKTWFKRPFVIGDARGVRSIVSGYDNYKAAKDSERDKETAQFGRTADILAGKTKEEQKRILADIMKNAGIEF